MGYILYITVVVVVISFSLIVSCIFISLLLVTVVIIYSRMGRSINLIRCGEYFDYIVTC